MKPASALALTAALLTTAPLAGCESIGDFIDIFSGKPSAAQRQHEAAARVTGAMLVPPSAVAPGAEAPPQQVAEIVPVVVQPVPEPVAPTYAYDDYNADPAGYQCQAVFRSLSCLDDGRPVYLGSQMEQLPFGTHP